MEHITITIYSDDPHLPPLVLVRDDAQHEGFGVADDGAESRGAVDCLASLDIWLATKYFAPAAVYLHPAEAQGLAAVPLAGGVGVAVLAAAGDAHVVVGAARPRVVPVHHRLHVQRRGRGHLARVSGDGEAHRVPGVLNISSNKDGLIFGTYLVLCLVFTYL